MSALARTAIGWVDQGLVPDAVIRSGIRRLCESRLQAISAGDCERAAAATAEFVAAMDRAPVALVPERANEQHYELPTGLFQKVLGIVGLIAGWLAGNVVKGGGFGLIGDIIVGVVGGLLGGWIASYFFHVGDPMSGSNLPSILIAFLGAIVALFLVRLLGGGRRRVLR